MRPNDIQPYICALCLQGTLLSLPYFVMLDPSVGLNLNDL